MFSSRSITPPTPGADQPIDERVGRVGDPGQPDDEHEPGPVLERRAGAHVRSGPRRRASVVSGRRLRPIGGVRAPRTPPTPASRPTASSGSGHRGRGRPRGAPARCFGTYARASPTAHKDDTRQGVVRDSSAASARRSTFCIGVSGMASTNADRLRAACTGPAGARGTCGAPRASGGRSSVDGDDDGDADLAHHVVGARDDDHVGDPRVVGEHRLHLRRVHVVATADEHLLEAAGQAQAAALVDEAEVAGAQPVAGERPGRWPRRRASSRSSRWGSGATPRRPRRRAAGRASSSQMPTSMPPRGRPTVKSASSSSASKAVPVPHPPLSVDE